MSTLRFRAVNETLNRKPIPVEEPARRSAIFGKNVFNELAMRQFLSKDSDFVDIDGCAARPSNMVYCQL